MLETYYDFNVPIIPGTRTDVYAAKILGKSERFMFKRQFLPCFRTRIKDGYRYVVDVNYYGIYEISVKRFEDEPDGKLIERSRTWLLVFDGEFHKIQQRAVLATLRNLRQYLKKHGGDAA